MRNKKEGNSNSLPSCCFVTSFQCDCLCQCIVYDFSPFSTSPSLVGIITTFMQ
ncbi:hypothetical protein Tsubulata_027171, partial [Turnera subulata]